MNVIFQHPSDPGPDERGPDRADTQPGDEHLAALLAETSRTFALSIPLLPGELRRRVTIAYLLFRLADTVEDEVDWPDHCKAAALRMFAGLLGGAGMGDAPDDGAADLIEAIAATRVDHEGYSALMADAAFVLGAYADLPAAPRATIARHLTRTAQGMADQLESGGVPGDVRGAQEYCYTVAGIVGELCTELFIGFDPSLEAARDQLMTLAPAFGEGLQLVNILRDELDDADAGRRYIPRSNCRDELFALALKDLHAASSYIRLLDAHGANPGTVGFNTLNVALAFETLALVAKQGAGAKLPRARVGEMLADIRTRIDGREPVTPVLDRSAATLA